MTAKQLRVVSGWQSRLFALTLAIGCGTSVTADEPQDGGQPDAGRLDGGAPDGSQPDGSHLDGGAPDGGQPDASDPSHDYTVGVFYYPWYGNGNFHGGEYLRGELEPPQSPTLGEYNDSDPEVIAQHLAWSRQAEINLWVASWWGPDSLTDRTLRDVILPHPDLPGVKVALFYETTGRLDSDDDPDNAFGKDMLAGVFPFFLAVFLSRIRLSFFLNLSTLGLVLRRSFALRSVFLLAFTAFGEYLANKI